MNIFDLEVRKQDSQGAGHYGAPRGSRKHNGVDFVCVAEAYVKSFTDGVVTKLGYPYNPNNAKKGHLRYVEVTTDGHKYRYFYISPLVSVGDEVQVGQPLGVSQDLTSIYKGMTQHFHFEIKDPNGKFIDPFTPFQEEQT